MRLLLDEHLSLNLAEELRSRGFDVLGVVEASLRGAEDQAVWEYAVAEARVLVTYDTADFLALLTRSFAESSSHPGLILLSAKTLPQADIGAQLRALERLLSEDVDLTDQVIFLRKESS